MSLKFLITITSFVENNIVYRIKQLVRNVLTNVLSHPYGKSYEIEIDL